MQATCHSCTAPFNSQPWKPGWTDTYCDECQQKVLAEVGPAAAANIRKQITEAQFASGLTIMDIHDDLVAQRTNPPPPPLPPGAKHPYGCRWILVVLCTASAMALTAVGQPWPAAAVWLLTIWLLAYGEITERRERTRAEDGAIEKAVRDHFNTLT